jgi:Aldo/keto reductases, related to diketogulonate reductase
VQQRIIPIPRTANPEHLAANLAIFDFALTDDEMAKSTASGSRRARGQPAACPQMGRLRAPR